MLKRIAHRALLIGLLVVVVGSSAQASDTDALIKDLQIKVKLNPDNNKALANLGAAYLQKGRETGDAGDYELAKTALKKSLSLVSTDPQAAFAMTQMAVAFMAEHRFVDAYNWAQRALAVGAGDPTPWAIAGDALADVGEYEQAAKAYARLTRKDGSEDEQQAIAYQRESRLSYLRFIAGDSQGALEHINAALQIANALHMPRENIAWSNCQLGEEHLHGGDVKLAEVAFQTALTHYPGYYRALVGLARTRTAQNNLPGAAKFYEQAIGAVPYPEYAAELGDVYRAMGEPMKAQKEYDLVEFIAHLSQINAEIHNRDLALFYADHGMKLNESVALARRELEVREDIYTWDVLAWALYKQADLKSASEAIGHALGQGTKDATIFFHAGMIRAGLGDQNKAQELLTNALAINPHFHPLHADEARQALARMNPTSALNGAQESIDAHR